MGKVDNLSVAVFFLAHPCQYDIPVPKERAEVHIRKNLESFGIIEEILSTITYCESPIARVTSDFQCFRVAFRRYCPCKLLEKRLNECRKRNCKAKFA